MNSITWLIDMLLHVNKELLQVMSQNGAWTYGIVFFFVFIETGLVICPFLPGDSLLVATGALAAHASFGISIGWLIVFTALAAFLGDTVNYWIGRWLGRTLLDSRHLQRLINKENIERANRIFNKYGGFAIFIGRFIPIVRTFIPFVAGVSRMNYPFFFFYNVLGALAWSLAGLLSGYYFGNIPLVKNHFTAVMILVIVVSVLPIILVWFRKRRTRQSEN